MRRCSPPALVPPALAIFVIACAFAALPAAADSVTLVPSQDTTLYENFSDSGNGTGEWIFAGQTNVGLKRRSLVQFDLSGLQPGTVIQSVAFKLTVSLGPAPIPRSASTGSPESWTEGGTNSEGPEGAPDLASPGDATWEFRSFPNNPWTTMGSTFVDTASASLAIPVTPNTYTWNSTAALVADVQFWVNNPGSNFGWLLKGTTETGNRRARRFNSRSNGTNPPQLVVTFVEAPFFGDGFESGDTSGWSLTEP